MADEIVPNVVVSMPSQLFTLARAFKAAANGRIYIGKIDTDPTIHENQIQVYLENEDGSHVPVAQPIVINAAGYPVYNGQIAKFVTVQGHSMAVYDAYGVQQFYYPNVLKYDPDQFRLEVSTGNGNMIGLGGGKTVADFNNYGDGNGDALIAVKQPFYGSKDMNQHDFNKLYINIMQFAGVTGDGTDQTAGIQAAINAASGNVLYIGNGVYGVSSALKIPSNTHIVMSPGAVIRRLSGGVDTLLINNSDGSIGGYQANTNIFIEGGTIDGGASLTASNCNLLNFGHCSDVRVSGVTFINPGGRWHAIEVNATKGILIESCLFQTGGLDEWNGECIQLDIADYGGFPWFGPYDGTTCADVKIVNNTVTDWACAVGMHTTLSGTQSYGLLIEGNSFYTSKSGIKLLNWSDVIISNNKIEWLAASVPSTQNSSRYFGISCEATYNTKCSNIQISNNHVKRSQVNVKTKDHRGIQVSSASNDDNYASTFSNVVVTGNVIEGAFRTHLNCSMISDAIIGNNKVMSIGSFDPADPTAINFAGISSYGVIRSVVTGNIVEGFQMWVNFGNRGTACESAIVTNNIVKNSNGIYAPTGSFLHLVLDNNITY